MQREHRVFWSEKRNLNITPVFRLRVNFLADTFAFRNFRRKTQLLRIEKLIRPKHILNDRERRCLTSS